MMNTIYDETHEMFRTSFRAFVNEEMVPRFDEWERQGYFEPAANTSAPKSNWGSVKDRDPGSAPVSPQVPARRAQVPRF